jgi:hypothetical protein
MTDEQANLLSATHKALGRQFAEFLAVAIGVAAEQYSDVLQTALGKVFDLTAVKHMATESVEMVLESKVQSLAALALGEQVNKQIDEIEVRLDNAAAALGKLVKKFEELEKRINRAALHMAKNGVAR